MSENTEIEIPNTIADIVTSKVVYIDGKKVGGVQAVNVDLDMREKRLLTLVTVTFAVKRGSLHITDVADRPGLQRVEFSTTNEAFK